MVLHIAGAAFVLLAAFGIGRITSRHSGASLAATTVLGMSVLSTALAVVFLFGFGYPIVLVALGSAGLVLRRGMRLSLPGNERMLWLLCCGFLAYAGFFALAPETQYDALYYHLPLPLEWLRLGAFPHRIGFYELLPQSMEVLFALSMVFDRVAQPAMLVHFACLPLSLMLLWDVARALDLPVWSAPAAGLAFASSPLVLDVSASAHTDIASVMAALAALYWCLRAWRSHAARDWLCTGLVCGFCYGIKISGAVVGAAVALLLIRRWSSLFAALSGMVLAVAPWVWRSWWWTGNPLSPVANRLFPNPYIGPETDAYLTGEWHFLWAVPWWEFPWELAVRGEKLQGLIGPAVLLIPLGLVAWRNPKSRLLVGGGVILLAPYCFNFGARFLLPALALLALAACAWMPRRVAVGAALVCCLAAAPRLRRPLWESDEAYLIRRVSLYPFAKLVRAQAEGALVFDCVGLPGYYSGTINQQHWQTAAMQRVHRGLLAAGPDPDPGVFPSGGFEYVTLPTWAGPAIPWVASVMERPAEWRLELVLESGLNRLYRVKRG